MSVGQVHGIKRMGQEMQAYGRPTGRGEELLSMHWMPLGLLHRRFLNDVGPTGTLPRPRYWHDNGPV